MTYKEIKPAHTNNASGFRGVQFDKRTGKWRARTKVNGQRVNLGFFDTPELAAAAYVVASHKYHQRYSTIASQAADLLKAASPLSTTNARGPHNANG
jgi:hypothetical protein